MQKPRNQIFLSVLRAALTDTLPDRSPASPEEWQTLFDDAQRQGIIGIVWDAAKKLPMPAQLRIEWNLVVQYMEQRNDVLDLTCRKSVHNFALDNIRTCILKGQALGQLYPLPHHRQPGDVDIWVEGGEDVVVAYEKKYFRQPVEHSWYHSALTLRNGVELELHYVPGHSNNRAFDALLQEFFVANAPWGEDGSDLFRPTSSPEAETRWVRFNSVYLVSHIITHMRAEGIGFKQVLDLYWLMRRYDSPLADVSPDIMKHIMPLYRALAWVFELIGMPADRLWVKPSKHLGRLLLHEMLSTGVVSVDEIVNGKYSKSKFRKFVHRTLRSIRISPILGAEPFHKLRDQLKYHLGKGLRG